MRNLSGNKIMANKSCREVLYEAQTGGQTLVAGDQGITGVTKVRGTNPKKVTNSQDHLKKMNECRSQGWELIEDEQQS